MFGAESPGEARAPKSCEIAKVRTEFSWLFEIRKMSGRALAKFARASI
jgi:hypothetical protein